MKKKQKKRRLTFFQRLRELAYQLRIIRRLPSPILTPLPIYIHTDALRESPIPNAARIAPDPAEAPKTKRIPETEWYVIAPKTVFGGMDNLAKAGVILCPITVRTTDGEMHGLAFPAHQRTIFESTFYAGATPNVSIQPTNREGTDWLEYAPGTGAIQIEPPGILNESLLQRAMSAASQRCAGVNIVFRDMENTDVPPSQVIANSVDGVLILYRARQLETTPFTTHSLYERESGSRREFSITRPQGTRHITDDSGAVIAEVFGNVVYILGDFLRFAHNNEAIEEALCRLIYECVSAALTSHDSDDDLASLWRASHEKRRDEYVATRFRSFEEKKNEFEKSIASCDDTIDKARKTITTAVRKRHETKQRLEAFIKSDCPSEQERLSKEFEQLVASPYIIGLEVKSGVITVLTRTITIPYRGHTYKIGRFSITLTEATGAITFANLSNTALKGREHACHPHIRSNGQACFGDLAPSIGILMGEREYAVVINLLFRFLEGYTDNNRFADIKDWQRITGKPKGAQQ